MKELKNLQCHCIMNDGCYLLILYCKGGSYFRLSEWSEEVSELSESSVTNYISEFYKHRDILEKLL